MAALAADPTPGAAAPVSLGGKAGPEGKVHPLPAGLFSYVKKDEGLPCVAVVYPLKVKKAHNDWPERDQRRRRWFSRRKAAERVAEPELRQIILTFDPSRH